MSEIITLRDNAVSGPLVPADISGNTIWSSGDQSSVVNGKTHRSARISFQFLDLVSTPSSGIAFNGVLEAKDKIGVYSPVGYTFNAFSNTENDREDSIVIDQQVNWTDGGVPNGFFITGRTVAQVSYNPITLPDTWRVCLAVLNPPGTVFTELNVNVFAELYNEV